MNCARVPAALRGCIQPTLTIEQVLKRIAYDRALNPTRRRLSADEFDEVVYDAVAREPHRSRASIVAWAKKNFEVCA